MTLTTHAQHDEVERTVAVRTRPQVGDRVPAHDARSTRDARPAEVLAHDATGRGIVFHQDRRSGAAAAAPMAM